MIYLEILTSIFLVIIMGYMSAIGTAYLSINEKKLKLSDIKNVNELKRLKEILKNRSTFISSIKSGISFCSLWISALIVEIVAMPIYRNIKIDFDGTAYLLKYFIILVSTILLAYTLYIIAETVPKSIAIKKKDKIVLSTVNFIYFTSKIFSPITKFMRMTENVIMRIFDVDRKEKISYKDSEMKKTVEISQNKGVISKQDSTIISNFLKLDEMTVEDIMIDIENVVMLDINSSKEEIKRKIINYGYTRMPVYDSDIRKVVGIINIKNILKSMISNRKIITKKHVNPCFNVSSGRRLDLLFNEMKKNKEHMAIIVKEDIAIGIVTMEDIIEQIVGSIEDDYEKYK